MKFRGLIFANLFRKKLRLVLTIGSFAIALVLFTFLAVVKSARDAKVDMDICPTCHGIWLDGGELAAIREMSAFTALADLLRFLMKD